jgi:hypothetical protein
MKHYIVKWGKKEEVFHDGEIKRAVKFAEEKAETGLNTSVWVVMDGVMDREPFFTCDWEI